MVLRAPGSAAAPDGASRAAASANGAIVANGPAASGGPPWAEHLAAVRGVLPEAAWKALTPEFYLLFWTLSTHDIHVPVAQCAPACMKDLLWVWHMLLKPEGRLVFKGRAAHAVVATR